MRTSRSLVFSTAVVALGLLSAAAAAQPGGEPPVDGGAAPPAATPTSSAGSASDASAPVAAPKADAGAKAGGPQAAAAPTVVSSASAPAPAPAPAPVAKKPAFAVTPYGLIVAQLEMGSNPVDSEDYPAEAELPTTNPVARGAFAGGSARQSRFGLKADGSAIAKAIGATELNAVLEADFQGGYLAANNGLFYMSLPRLRLASVHLVFGPEEIILGQDWGLVGPVAPLSLSHVSTQALVGAGNLFANRFPMLASRTTLGIFGFEVGVLAPTGTDPGSQNPPAITVPRTQGGPDKTMLPSFQARVSLSPRVLGQKATIGLGGHYSRMQLTPAATATPPDPQTQVDSWALCADLVLPITKVFTVRGEAFYGANLSQFSTRAGVIGGQSELTRAGWMQVSVTPPGKFGFHVSGGIEAPDVPATAAAGAIQDNIAFEPSISYNIWEKFAVGVEYDFIETVRLNQPDATAHVVTVAVDLGF
jgi:hypothetical protein